jgi:cytochrome c oxidase subunit 2
MWDYVVLAHQVPEDWRAQAEVFGQLFTVFLAIGTLVGVVVVSYTLYHAYKARARDGDDSSFEPPVLGELPTGQTGPKSKKLFLSFGLSAVIVISLVVYSYFLLLYVEQGPTEDVSNDTADELEVEVVGIQFGWQFHYANGVQTFNELRVPKGRLIRLTVTSNDVWHAFGVPSLRIKADAIPGQYQETWFFANETGTYDAACYELCGSGHAEMNADIVVMEEEEFEEWYEQQGANATQNESTPGAESTPGGENETHDRVGGPAEAVAA